MPNNHTDICIEVSSLPRVVRGEEGRDDPCERGWLHVPCLESSFLVKRSAGTAVVVFGRVTSVRNGIVGPFRLSDESAKPVSKHHSLFMTISYIKHSRPCVEVRYLVFGGITIAKVRIRLTLAAYFSLVGVRRRRSP